MKTQIILILVGFSFLGNAYFVPHVECSCQQMITQQDCSDRANCLWNPIDTDSSSGYCEPQPCSSLDKQQCLSSQQCYYQPGNPGTPFCFAFQKCENIELTANQTCQQARPNCVPSNLQKPQCIAAEFSCSTLQTQAQCQPAQSLTLAGEGLCYWNGQQCKVVTSCGDVLTKTQCQMPFLSNACNWVGNACVALQCSNLTQTNCNYVQQNPMSGSSIQPCYWNNTICAPANVDQLTIADCAKNTNNHYRWAPINKTQGICAQCNSKKYIYRNQCECKQLLQQQECISSPSCIWEPAQTGQPAACKSNTCEAITNQQTCAQIQGCYWNSQAAIPVCAVLSSCSAILGKNSQACFQQSIFCPGSNGTNCLNQQSLPPCSSIKQPNICYNSMGNDGYCTYNSNGCQSLTSCGDLSTIQQCNQFTNSCMWNSNQCQQKTCSYYLTKESCTFVQNGLSNNVINICTWNPNTQQCYAYDNSFDYDINSCFNSTGRTHHWSEPSNASKGLCLPCHYSSVLNVKSNCQCADLINYTDCALSSPKCFWNSAATVKCQNQSCPQLTSQGSCVMSKYCYWTDSTGCQAIGSPSTTCANIKANTQQECLSQSILCAGINNGKCSSSLNSCSDFQTFYQCFGSVGTDGICQWNQAFQQCQGIQYCNMIQTEAQCSLVVNTCYWQTQANGTQSCAAYNCTTLFANTQSCNFYLSTPNQNYEVNLCYLEGTSCNSANNLSSLTSTNCYASSGGTARWNTDGNGTCQYCYSQLISVIFIVFIYLF